MSLTFNTIFGQFKIDFGSSEPVPSQDSSLVKDPSAQAEAEAQAATQEQAAPVAPEEPVQVPPQQLTPPAEEKVEKKLEEDTDSQEAPAGAVLEKPSPLTRDSEKKDVADAPVVAAAVEQPEVQTSPSAQAPEEKKRVDGSAEEKPEEKAPSPAETKNDTKPVPGSVHQEVPAIPDMVRRAVEKALPAAPSVQDRWDALVESICVSQAEKAKVQGLLRDLWENLLPPLPPQTQKLFQDRLATLHQEVSRQLAGSDLSPKSFADAVSQAQDGLERTVDVAHKAIEAICTPGQGSRK